MHRTTSGLLLILLAASGCEKRPAPSPNSPPSRTQAGPIIPEDRSLTTEEYVLRGIPPPDLVWSGHDYSKSVEVLKVLARTNPDQLPRYQSHRSGVVFSRMAAEENLQSLKNRERALSSRFPSALELMPSFKELMALYHEAGGNGPSFDAEVIELVCLQFRLIPIVVDLIHEFLPTIEPDDPNRATRMKGLDQVRQGLATSAIGALQMLEESERYRPECRVRLARVLTETLPRFLNELSAPSRAEILQGARRTEDREAEPNLKQALRELREALPREP